jgi:dephospho-CoA kinase
MTTLAIAITAPSRTDAGPLAAAWRGRARDVQVAEVEWPPDLSAAATAHLVVGIDSASASHDPADAVDVWITSADADGLWRERNIPFRDNVVAKRRAPRRRVPALCAPDVTWPAQARRLIARLELVLGPAVERLDHIGSTSVPGLPAKDLIDIQVVVADLAVAERCAERAGVAGESRSIPRIQAPPRRDNGPRRGLRSRKAHVDR